MRLQSLAPYDIHPKSAIMLAGASGLLTAVAAAGPIFSFRWIDTTRLCVPLSLAWGWFVTTAFTAAQVVDHQAKIARAFTASDTGGAVIVLTGNNGKMRTAYEISASPPDARIATTGALAAGTRTLDATPIAYNGAWAGGLGQGLALRQFDFEPENGVHPIILAPSEGIVVENVTLMGAAGVIKWFAFLRYLETPVF